MFILHNTTLPNGVDATVHRLQRAEQLDGELNLVINAYMDERNEFVVWQAIFIVPSDVPDGTEASILNWLISEEGPFPGGQIIEDDINGLDWSKAHYKMLINKLRDRYTNIGCQTPVGKVDSNEKSRVLINQSATDALFAKMTNEPWSIEWRMYDNSLVTVDADDMIAIHRAVTSHTVICSSRAIELKNNVQAAQDENELRTIVIGSGWPIDDSIQTPPGMV